MSVVWCGYPSPVLPNFKCCKKGVGLRNARPAFDIYLRSRHFKMPSEGRNAFFVTFSGLCTGIIRLSCAVATSQSLALDVAKVHSRLRKYACLNLMCLLKAGLHNVEFKWTKHMLIKIARMFFSSSYPFRCKWRNSYKLLQNPIRR